MNPLFDSPLFDDLALAQQLSEEFAVRESISRSQGSSDDLTSSPSLERVDPTLLEGLDPDLSAFLISDSTSTVKRPSLVPKKELKGLEGSTKRRRRDKKAHQNVVISKRPPQIRVPIHPSSLIEEQESLGLALTLHSQCLARTKVEDVSPILERIPEQFLDGSFQSYEQLFLSLALLLDSPVLLDAFQKAFAEKLRAGLSLSLPPSNLAPCLQPSPPDPFVERAQEFYINVHQYGCTESEDFEKGFNRGALEAFLDPQSFDALLDQKIISSHKGKYFFSLAVSAPFWDLPSFLLRQPSHHIRSHRLAVNRFPEIALNELRLPFFRSLSPRLLERFAKLVTEKGNFVHTVDLSFTNLTPSSLHPLLRHVGKGLTSLTLKGCPKLEDPKSIELLSRYCTKALRHFAPWEGIDPESLSTLLSKLENVNYLDLSYCSNIPGPFLESLGDLTYLDLSFLGCPLDKRAFRSWLSKRGKRLEALLLVPSHERHPGEWCDDSLLASIAQYCSNSLRILDITYSFDITEVGIDSLAKCSFLEVLRFSADLKKASTASSQSLVNLLRALPRLQHFEIEKSETHVHYPLLPRFFFHLAIFPRISQR